MFKLRVQVEQKQFLVKNLNLVLNLYVLRTEDLANFSPTSPASWGLNPWCRSPQRVFRPKVTKYFPTRCETASSTPSTMSGAPTLSTSRWRKGMPIWWPSWIGTAERFLPGRSATRWTAPFAAGLEGGAATHGAETKHLQHRPRQPVHWQGVDFRASKARHSDQHGWPRPLDGQRLHRAAVAKPKI